MLTFVLPFIKQTMGTLSCLKGAKPTAHLTKLLSICMPINIFLSFPKRYYYKGLKIKGFQNCRRSNFQWLHCLRFNVGSCCSLGIPSSIWTHNFVGLCPTGTNSTSMESFNIEYQTCQSSLMWWWVLDPLWHLKLHLFCFMEKKNEPQHLSVVIIIRLLINPYVNGETLREQNQP